MDISAKLNLFYPAAKPASTAADKSPQVLPVDRSKTMTTSKDSDPSTLKMAVQQIETFMQSIKRNLEFSIDEGSGKVVVKVIASESGELVRQIPSEEVLTLAESLNSASNVLFNAKA